MRLRPHTFLGMTQSLCPECLAVVPAKIVTRQGRVYFLNRCPTHGEREDFVCSDVDRYDQMEFTVPSRMPLSFGVEPQKGCPHDCGLCTDHEQHTCIGLVEITSSCNLTCPMCYAASAPGGRHLSLDECKRAFDRLVEVEGRPEVLQLSGGEPTIHPEFVAILDDAVSRPIDYVMINTNGLRFARDPALVDAVARHRRRVEVYLQFDGFSDEVYARLRGERLLQTKLAAIDALGKAGVNTTLVTTLDAGVNDDEIGPIVNFGLERPWITGVSFQPATYSGRCVVPDRLERRITFPDVIDRIVRQTGGPWRESDFMPLPCAHPNCHSMAYAYRGGGKVVPLTRFINARENLDLLANGISFTRPKVRDLIEQYLGRLGCCGGAGCAAPGDDSDSIAAIGRAGGGGPLPIIGAGGNSDKMSAEAEEFFRRVMAQQLGAQDVFRITITSFLDAYNFDVRRLMKCCIHHILPSGHIIPFCAYNVLYRDGHVPLPVLRQAMKTASS